MHFPWLDLAIETLKKNPGALISFSLQLGALIGGADPQQIEALDHFGRNLALFRQKGDNVPSWHDLITMQLENLSYEPQRKELFELWLQSSSWDGPVLDGIVSQE